MAITAVLVYAGHNRLRYFVNSTVGGGEAVEITSSGAATPDLETDSLAGPIKQISRVAGQGYGKISAAGVTTVAQAAALLLSNDNLALVGPNNPTLIARYEQRSGTVGAFQVDAVLGVAPGTPSLTVTNSSGGAASCYVDLEIPGSIGA